MTYIKKIILIIIMFLGLLACAKKGKVASSAQSPLTFKTGGATNFGKVALGDSKESLLVITNPSSESRKIAFSRTSGVGLFDPSFNGFEILESSCIQKDLLMPGESCDLKIRFNAISQGLFEETLKFSDSEVNLKGQVIKGTSFTLSSYIWDTGVLSAGESSLKQFRVINTGLSSLAKPNINSSIFQISFSDCPDFLSPGQECTIELKYVDTRSGFKRFNLSLSNDVSEAQIFFQSQVVSGTPSGQIIFEGIPSNFVAGSNNQSIVRARVYDEYLNPVLDGTEVTFSGTNINILGSNKKNIHNGYVDLAVIATSVAQPVTVSAGSGLASGTFTRESKAGSPAGDIMFQNFNGNMLASGNDARLVKSVPMVDSYQNAIPNDLSFEVSVTGPVLVCDNVQNCEKTAFLNPSDGILSIKLKSEKTSGAANIVVRCLLPDGQICATGTFQINVHALAAQGDFAISTDFDSLSVSPNMGKRGSVHVEIGPLKDQYFNPRLGGDQLEVTLLNAQSSSQEQNFTLITATDGLASFDLQGIGTPGIIRIKASSHGVTVTKDLWAATNKTSNVDNSKIKLYRADQPWGLPLVPFDESHWNRVHYENSTTLAIDGKYLSDSSFIGSGPRSILEGLPHISQRCMVGAREVTFLGPCATENIDSNGNYGFGYSSPLAISSNLSVFSYPTFFPQLVGASDKPFDQSLVGISSFYLEKYDLYLFGGHTYQTTLGIAPNPNAYIIGYPSVGDTGIRQLNTTLSTTLFYQIGKSGASHLKFKDKGILSIGGMDMNFSGLPSDSIKFFDTSISYLLQPGANTEYIATKITTTGDKKLQEYNQYLTNSNLLGVNQAETKPAMALSRVVKYDDHTFFLIGGIGHYPANTNNVTSRDEVWKLKISTDFSAGQWKRVCPLAPDPALFQTEASIQAATICLQSPSLGIDSSVFSSMIYPFSPLDIVSINKQLALHRPPLAIPPEYREYLSYIAQGPAGHSEYITFDDSDPTDIKVSILPFNSPDALRNTSESAADFLTNYETMDLKNRFFNEEMARGFSISPTSGALQALATPRGKVRQYLAIVDYSDVLIGGIQEASITTEAWGQLGRGADIFSGIDLFAYDFDALNWKKIGSSTASSRSESKLAPITYVLNPDELRSFSRQGKINLLFRPSQDPLSLPMGEVDYTFELGYLKIEGLW